MVIHDASATTLLIAFLAIVIATLVAIATILYMRLTGGVRHAVPANATKLPDTLKRNEKKVDNQPFKPY